MQMDELLEKREQILAIAARHGAERVRLFGSVVHGDATDASDVDFLIDPPSTSFLTYMHLIQELEDLLGRPVDVVSEGQLHWVVRDAVLRDAIPL